MTVLEDATGQDKPAATTKQVPEYVQWRQPGYIKSRIQGLFADRAEVRSSHPMETLCGLIKMPQSGQRIPEHLVTPVVHIMLQDKLLVILKSGDTVTGLGRGPAMVVTGTASTASEPSLQPAPGPRLSDLARKLYDKLGGFRFQNTDGFARKQLFQACGIPDKRHSAAIEAVRELKRLQLIDETTMDLKGSLDIWRADRPNVPLFDTSKARAERRAAPAPVVPSPRLHLVPTNQVPASKRVIPDRRIGSLHTPADNQPGFESTDIVVPYRPAIQPGPTTDTADDFDTYSIESEDDLSAIDEAAEATIAEAEAATELADDIAGEEPLAEDERDTEISGQRTGEGKAGPVQSGATQPSAATPTASLSDVIAAIAASGTVSGRIKALLRQRRVSDPDGKVCQLIGRAINRDPYAVGRCIHQVNGVTVGAQMSKGTFAAYYRQDDPVLTAAEVEELEAYWAAEAAANNGPGLMDEIQPSTKPELGVANEVGELAKLGATSQDQVNVDPAPSESAISPADVEKQSGPETSPSLKEFSLKTLAHLRIGEQRTAAILHALASQPGGRWDQMASAQLNLALPAAVQVSTSAISQLLFDMHRQGLIEQRINGRLRQYARITDLGRQHLAGLPVREVPVDDPPAEPVTQPAPIEQMPPAPNLAPERPIHLAEGLDLGIEAIVKRWAILGSSGSGKTNAAVVMSESIIGQGWPVAVFDFQGVWWGIRSSLDGQSPGLPVYIFGGEHGDADLHHTDGRKLARMLDNERVSMILDLSDFDEEETSEFVAYFFDTTFYRKRQQPIMLIMDEADEYVPQNGNWSSTAEEKAGKRLKKAGLRLAKRGRTRGIGQIWISQRPQELLKGVLAQVEAMLGLRFIEPRDLAKLAEWLNVHVLDAEVKRVIQRIPALGTGHALVHAPAWLGDLRQVKIRQRVTYDSSATPEPGVTPPEVKAWAEVNMALIDKYLKGRIAQTLSRRECEDRDDEDEDEYETDKAVQPNRAITHDADEETESTWNPSTGTVDNNDRSFWPLGPGARYDIMAMSRELIKLTNQLSRERLRLGNASHIIERLEAEVIRLRSDLASALAAKTQAEADSKRRLEAVRSLEIQLVKLERRS